MQSAISDDVMTFYLKGRIDTSNSAEVEKEIFDVAEKEKPRKIILNCNDLVYISSAGLRVLMKIKKEFKDVVIDDVSLDVYEILSMTGFTEIIPVNKKLRSIMVKEENLLGAGANGKVYRLDNERIVKLYNPVSNPPEKIKREKQSARQAFIHGIPSAIPFDLVMVGNQYGMIYELINAITLGEYVHKNPDTLEEYALKMSLMLKELHSTEFKEDELPDARFTLKVWVNIAEKSGYYQENELSKVYGLIESIPYRNTFIHGDFHPGNIMISDGELFLIDMGDASVGHPICDLLAAFQLMKFLPSLGKEFALKYTGLAQEEVTRMWNIFFSDYIGTDDERELAEYENTLRYYGLIRSLAGVSFTEFVPDDVRRARGKLIMDDILSGIDNDNVNIDFLT